MISEQLQSGGAPTKLRGVSVLVDGTPVAVFSTFVDANRFAMRSDAAVAEAAYDLLGRLMTPEWTADVHAADGLLLARYRCAAGRRPVADMRDVDL